MRMREPARRNPRSQRTKPAPPRTRKVPTNLSLSTELVRRARALDLNLSRVVESALEKAIIEAEQARWLDDNKEAIAQYNAFVEQHGYFGEEFRDF